jgi:hypothetical protein
VKLIDNQDIGKLKRGALTKKQPLKHDSFKKLLAIAQENPQRLYTDWDFFASLITSDKGADTKYIGIYIIAHITRVDTEGKFEKMFDTFYSLLDDDSLIPPSHAALVSGMIVNNLPHLAKLVTDRLLEVDATHHVSRRKDLIKSYVIDAFDTYFDKLCDTTYKTRILAFVAAQQECHSPKTRKLARAFLKKRGLTS